MPPRFRTSILVAFAFLFLYLVFPIGKENFPYENGEQRVDLLKGAGPGTGHGTGEGYKGQYKPKPAPTNNPERPPSARPTALATSTIIAVPGATSQAAESELTFQEQYDKEYDALGLKETAGKIYGNSLNNLIGAETHAGFAAAALIPTESWTSYSDTPPYTYNPYPEYNSKVWSAANKGTYVPCDGPEGEVRDVRVFSGHPEFFTGPALGSYTPLDIDSNLCFERESRLGAYGYQEEVEPKPSGDGNLHKRMDWNTVNWGQLQEFCVQKNADRYIKLEEMPHINDQFAGLASNSSINSNGTAKMRRAETTDAITDEAEARRQGLHGMPQIKATEKSRTAVLLRSYSGKNYTENDKHNIRSLVSELSLRTGSEYQVYLLVQIKEDLPIWTDSTVHEKAIQDSVPKEFWDMTVLWNDAIMREWYPLIPEKVNNVHQSQWLSVQKFALENPQFEYFWNWELDSRYTGHHYNLLEKLATFARAQPRKYLWERNERYYVSKYHGPYDSKFRKTVEALSGSETIWGAVPVPNIKAIGPPPPVTDQAGDDYRWGVDEEADYISLAPIFDPINTTWPGRNDVWGYDGTEKTPRRATIGTQSRCSRKLLNAMHEENKKGNHVSSEMTPQTVALLHGLKAVYAPIPIFLDRQWEPLKIQKWFNPGPKGVSGSTEESPFSWGREVRFEGSTWYYRAVPPMRLFNNWMGWEDSGIGGAEWEKSHGRTCLPPMLLHPIKDVVKPPPGHFSKSELPY